MNVKKVGRMQFRKPSSPKEGGVGRPSISVLTSDFIGQTVLA
jgi:hypothetical protein